MGRKKQAEGTQRTYQVMVRFRPEVKNAIIGKLKSELIKEKPRCRTISGLVRVAVWEFCSDNDDPRQP